MIAIEAPEVKLARIEEKIDSLCHGQDLLRASMEKEISELWHDAEKIGARLTVLEAVELQRKGGRVAMAAGGGACLAAGGLLLKFFEWLKG